MYALYRILDSKLDESGKVIGLNIGKICCFVLQGSPAVAWTDKDVFDECRLGQLPGQSMLPAAGSDEKDPEQW